LLTQLEHATRALVRARTRTLVDEEVPDYYKALWVVRQALLAYPRDEELWSDALIYAADASRFELEVVWTQVLRTFGAQLPDALIERGREFSLCTQ
jgi:hypothetical protein